MYNNFIVQFRIPYFVKLATWTAKGKLQGHC